MILPDFFYTQPQFRAASADAAKLKNATEWTLDTPGVGLALALDYYRFEAFATRKDRDAACGPTAHEDVRYVAATDDDLYREEIMIDDIACGHSVDHPRFDEVVSPLFDAALKRLIRDVVDRPKDAKGKIASTEIFIARTRYSIAAEAVDDWIKFPVAALAVFERGDQGVMDGTVDWLQNRLVLTASPSLFDTEAN
ncbi:hypothetical protein ACVWXL_005852 [Bradyrhizobium sp. GM22.5]